MTLTLCKPSTYKQTKWSGGVTTELYIYPNGSSLQQLDFKYRISTAMVELEESIFTVFMGVQRTIVPLKGEMTLVHDNRKPVHLQHFEQYSFSGESITQCVGKVIDFNFMTMGDTKGIVEIIQLQPRNLYSITAKNVVLYCYSGQLFIEQKRLMTHETMVIENEKKLVIQLLATTPVVLVKVEILL